MLWDFEILFLTLWLFELYTALCSHRVTEQCRRDPRRPPPPWCGGIGCARVILGSYFSNTLQPLRMETLQIPLIIYCSALPPWQRWSFSYCVTWISLAAVWTHHRVCYPSLGEVKNSSFPFCLWKTLSCMRIVTTSLLLPSFFATNQLQFFWETFQPIQINIVLQCMWLHTTGKKKHIFSSAMTFIVKAMFLACVWNISLAVSLCGSLLLNSSTVLLPSPSF